MNFQVNIESSSIFRCGSAVLNGKTLEIHRGNVIDAHKLGATCIVNAANKNLRHNGGLAGAIASMAGPKFEEESAKYVQNKGSLKPTQAICTGPGKLEMYNIIIHVAGPIVNNGYLLQSQKEELRNCVYNSIELATEKNEKSIGVPGISCGIFGFPKEEAAKCHIQAFEDFATKTKFPKSSLTHIHFILFSDEELQYFANEFLQRIENDHYHFANLIGLPSSQSGLLTKYCGVCSSMYENNYFSINVCHTTYCDYCIYRYQIKKCSKCTLEFSLKIEQNKVYCRLCKEIKERTTGACFSCNNICADHNLEKCSHCEKLINYNNPIL